MLREKDVHLNTSLQDQELVRDIKEQMCYVVNDFDHAVKEASESTACEKQYDLPDGRKLTLGVERFKAGEALF